MILFLALLALLAAGTAAMVVQLTDPEPGRHAAPETRVWPPFVRARHADAKVTEPAEITFRFGSQPEAVAP